MGLSQGEVPVEVNRIVSKGLAFRGSIRSRMEHYVTVLDLLRDERFRVKVRRMFSKERFTIRSAGDLEEAFGYTDTREVEARTKPGRVLVYFL